MADPSLHRTRELLTNADLCVRRGRVTELVGLVIEATGLAAEVGELATVDTGRRREPVPAEVVGFRAGRTLLMPLGDLAGIGPGTSVTPTGGPFTVAVGPHLQGRVLDGLGRPIDGGADPGMTELRSAEAAPPSPLERVPIADRLELGVRVLDTLVPCGRGQRLGIFAGSGVGKSMLLGQIARSNQGTVNVICLVGERGRELREFLDRDLGEGLSRSVVVVATSDQPALVRIKAAQVATTIAEYFRDQGADVMLMMDSVTRLALAQREVGLAIGEPPATRGYTPSVFALLPRILERAGTAKRGSITGLYTVLVEGDDMNEPVADTVRSVLDGHCVLRRELAHAGHYPAVDVLESISRLNDQITPAPVRAAAAALRQTLAAYRQKQDLISLGVYTRGSDTTVDYAVAKLDEINQFLCQSHSEATATAAADDRLIALMADHPTASAELVRVDYPERNQPLEA